MAPGCLLTLSCEAECPVHRALNTSVLTASSQRPQRPGRTAWRVRTRHAATGWLASPRSFSWKMRCRFNDAQRLWGGGGLRTWQGSHRLLRPGRKYQNFTRLKVCAGLTGVAARGDLGGGGLPKCSDTLSLPSQSFRSFPALENKYCFQKGHVLLSTKIFPRLLRGSWRCTARVCAGGCSCLFCSSSVWRRRCCCAAVAEWCLELKFTPLFVVKGMVYVSSPFVQAVVGGSRGGSRIQHPSTCARMQNPLTPIDLYWDAAPIDLYWDAAPIDLYRNAAPIDLCREAAPIDLCRIAAPSTFTGMLCIMVRRGKASGLEQGPQNHTRSPA